MTAPTLTTDRYDCGTVKRARAVAKELRGLGWSDVVATGTEVTFATLAGNVDARYQVSVICGIYDISGRAL